MNGKATINALLRAPVGLLSRLRIAVLRGMGMRIGKRCRLVRVVVPCNPWDIALEDGVALDERVVLLVVGQGGTSPRIRIGPRAYVNRNTVFDASLSICVGADVMIGPFCYISDHDHGTAAEAPVARQPLVEAAVVIEDNVWLGAGVIVLKGVRIGRGAVVAAGSVVTHDVPAGLRVAGVPARPILAGNSAAHG